MPEKRSPMPPPTAPTEEELAQLAAERERAEAQAARDRELRESVRRRQILARWLPRSANGLAKTVPGVTPGMLTSPGQEHEAEVGLSRLAGWSAGTAS